jgi:hypothetical protein
MYCISEEFVKPSLTAAFIVESGQSMASKIKDTPFPNDRIVGPTSDMTEIQKRNLFKNFIQKIEIICITTERVYKYSEQSVLLTYVMYIDHDEIDRKENILSYSKLLTQNVSVRLVEG